MISALRNIARQFQTKLLRRMGRIGGSWENGLPAELQFWRSALSNPSAHWSEEYYRFRTDPEAPFQPELRELLAGAPDRIRILDVGAGPLTSLGKVWPGRSIEITAVDPLAGDYDKLLNELKINPPVRTTVAEAERLSDSVKAEEFDLAYASNSLDHCRDPLEAIRQMLRAVKPGACVYLWHFANEGLTERYTGLHQWDFNVQNGDFIIGDGRSSFTLGESFGEEAEVSTQVTQAYGKRVVIGILRKFPPK